MAQLASRYCEEGETVELFQISRALFPVEQINSNFLDVGDIFGDCNRIDMGHEAWMGKASVWEGEDGEGLLLSKAASLPFHI